ncbi:MAG: hypothetical protein IKO47_06245 [Ruminococcus sp.]|nr:hypothetical protein [Ruminococcus sp.]
MKTRRTSTVQKSIRIPKRVADSIEKEAADKNRSFSDIANYRLKQSGNSLTPAMLVKLQNIANLAVEAVEEKSTTKAKEAQKEVAKLWNCLK